MKMAGASVPKRNYHTDSTSKAVKVIEYCHSVDELIVKFQVFLVEHSKLCELDVFCHNKTGSGLLN